VKNTIYTLGVLLHLAIAQYAFLTATWHNDFMLARGSVWITSPHVDNPFAGMYDFYMAFAWLVGAALVLWASFAMKLNLLSKIIGGFFLYSTWNNCADFIGGSELLVNQLLDYTAIGAYLMFVLIISLKTYEKWKKLNG